MALEFSPSFNLDKIFNNSSDKPDELIHPKSPPFIEVDELLNLFAVVSNHFLKYFFQFL